jgi:uncharacterized protein YjbI with pentapeptide repeats
VPWRPIIRWAGLLAAVAAMVTVIVVLFGPVTDLIARHDVGSVTGSHRAAALRSARDAARGRLLQLGAGLFAAAALIYTARNFTLSREGQVTDRYTKAIEQLGSGQLDVRIGGIYALERVARDSVRDHPTIMEVLAAFIREHSHEQLPPSGGSEPGAAPPARRTRPDVQAAVTVLGRRNPRHDRQRINLAAAALVGADLTGADLTDADLTGADLTSADLPRATLTRANLDNADLTGADLNGADLTSAYLYRATLNGTDLHRATLTRANLPRAILRGANLDNADLNDADLPRADLIGAQLGGATLTGADLTHADLTGANLNDADLTGADLTGAGLTGATLNGADLTGADLTGARLGANPSVVPPGWVITDSETGELRPVTTV